MPTSILVTGGTGTLGRQVAARLVAGGHEVRVLSRKSPVPNGSRVGWAVGNLRTGDGIDAAVAGVDVIVHCATAPRGDADAARHLLDAARRAGSPHLVYISIVGVNCIPLGYYTTKLQVERLLIDSGLPVTILRATQFHTLLARMFSAQRVLPVLIVPARTSFQPIAVGEVADRLVDLALADPAGRVPDLGGPQMCPAADLARSYLHTVRRRRTVLPLWIPGRVGRGYRSGGHLTPEHADGHLSFEQYLATGTSAGNAR